MYPRHQLIYVNIIKILLENLKNNIRKDLMFHFFNKLWSFKVIIKPLLLLRELKDVNKQKVKVKIKQKRKKC